MPQQVISNSAFGATIGPCRLRHDLDGDGDAGRAVGLVLRRGRHDRLVREHWTGRVVIGSAQQVIYDSQADPAQQAPHATDLDGDGDADVLSSSAGDNKIAWYENTDGRGLFGSPQVITTGADGASTVRAADIDGDGDMDVLSASFNDNKVAWYENTDGKGGFGTQRVISTTAAGASSMEAFDVDGDGDLDVVSSSRLDDKIAWYENTDGLGSFSPERVITSTADGAQSIHLADVDGDGDADVLAASRYDRTIAWYENTDGLGAFAARRVIAASVQIANSVYAADVDGDGDADVLAAAYDDSIFWYENIDSRQNSWAQRLITTRVVGAEWVYAADIDNDGDADVLSASSRDNKIAWYENTDGQRETSGQSELGYRF